MIYISKKYNQTMHVGLTDQFVALRLPRRRFSGGGVEFVVQQREGLLAGERVARKEGAVADGELDLDVDAISLRTLDERRPQPVVDVMVGHVAHHIRSPVDALFEVGETLLHPLKAQTEPSDTNQLGRLQNQDSRTFFHD